jgi:23S rRNA (pseudouridine1915-N3)-methyltransferase
VLAAKSDELRDRDTSLVRIIVAAVGRLKEEPERELFAHYARRFDQAGRGVALGPLQLSEIAEGRAASAAERKSDEAARLLKTASPAAVLVVLDVKGKAMTSEALAKWIAARRDEGVKTLAFLIGGPDGHGKAALEAATLTLSLGALTFPHGLARIVLAEQIYRAATIVAGHPYHRG